MERSTGIRQLQRTKKDGKRSWTLKILRKDKQKITINMKDVRKEEAKLRERCVEYFRELVGIEGQDVSIQ
ncbi:hypothetical protein FQA39_LY00820 [Lamprigera yunnana]|nr:hypothetical protein FQA39_LY00820 [Lamprigera yunnana]